MSEDLLQTKLYIPTTRPYFVPRRHLLKRLGQGLQTGGKLTLVAAPAGYGKTTLISHWSSQEDAQFGWITLDPHDNDPGRFLAYIYAAIRSAGVDVDVPLMDLVRSPQVDSSTASLIPLINRTAQSPGRYVLVLDDFHHIDDEVCHQLTAYLLDHVPANLHLVIATRSDPPLTLARLRAQGQMTEIRAEHLRFSEEESGRFLVSANEVELTPEQVEILAKRTGGWISGLQLAALSLVNHRDPAHYVHKFAGTNQNILDYLTEEVLRRQPVPVQQFMLRTSILSELSGPLCDAVNGMANGRDTLTGLLEANAFISPLDEDRNWFRYHRLFADVLFQRLQQIEPELIPELHRRAWVWLAQHDRGAMALDHALAAAAFEQAAEMMEQLAETTLLHGEIKTFLLWVDQLPANVARQRPLLSLYHAEALLLSGLSFAHVAARLQGASEHVGLRALQAIYQGNFQENQRLTAQALIELPADSYFIKAALVSASAATFLMAGDVRQAEKSYAQAIALAEQGDNLLVQVVGTVRKAQLLAIGGRVADADSVCQHALELATDSHGQRRPLASFPLFYLAFLSYLRHDIPAALERSALAIELASRYGGFWTIDCFLTRALILQAAGEHDASREAMALARELAKRTQANPFDDIYTAAYQAQLWVLLGDLTKASRWARQRKLLGETGVAGFNTAKLPFHLFELEQLILARLHLALKQPEIALSLLVFLEPALTDLNRLGSLVENLALQAVAYQMKNDQAMALDRLSAALAMTEPDGALRVFFEQRTTLFPLLPAVTGPRPAFNLAARLLSWEHPPLVPRKQSAEAGIVESLTDRELKVLHKLATDQTIPDIADQLSITVSTLRTHVRNIYGKLGVHSRFEAISHARKLDLLSK